MAAQDNAAAPVVPVIVSSTPEISAPASKVITLVETNFTPTLNQHATVSESGISRLIRVKLQLQRSGHSGAYTPSFGCKVFSAHSFRNTKHEYDRVDVARIDLRLQQHAEPELYVEIKDMDGKSKTLIHQGAPTMEFPFFGLQASKDYTLRVISRTPQWTVSIKEVNLKGAFMLQGDLQPSASGHKEEDSPLWSSWQRYMPAAAPSVIPATQPVSSVPVPEKKPLLPTKPHNASLVHRQQQQGGGRGQHQGGRGQQHPATAGTAKQRNYPPGGARRLHDPRILQRKPPHPEKQHQTNPQFQSQDFPALGGPASRGGTTGSNTTIVASTSTSYLVAATVATPAQVPAPASVVASEPKQPADESKAGYSAVNIDHQPEQQQTELQATASRYPEPQRATGQQPMPDMQPAPQIQPSPPMMMQQPAAPMEQPLAQQPAQQYQSPGMDPRYYSRPPYYPYPPYPGGYYYPHPGAPNMVPGQDAYSYDHAGPPQGMYYPQPSAPHPGPPGPPGPPHWAYAPSFRPAGRPRPMSSRPPAFHMAAQPSVAASRKMESVHELQKERPDVWTMKQSQGYVQPQFQPVIQPPAADTSVRNPTLFSRLSGV